MPGSALRRMMAKVGSDPEEMVAVPWEFRRQSVVCSEALLRIMRHAVATYGADLETTIIHLAIVCGSASGALRDPGLSASPPPPGRLDPRMYGTVSRRQIAASTGLPRETVRRKIALLLERGELVAVGSRLRVRPGLLEEPANAAFAQTILREFARAGAVVDIPAEAPAVRSAGSRPVALA